MTHLCLNPWLRKFLGLALLLLASRAAAQELYVGANYHPHDSSKEIWTRDIQLMKSAGFRVVRMGHLAWDSFEPSEGKFDFGWFDEVMDQMGKAGIKVILDVAVRPAPLWLHRKYPSINVGDANGVSQYPNTRYMEDVGDPHYQESALQFADTLTKRYRHHPALLAFGIDNEPGDGPISYSATVKERYIDWLKNKYPDVEHLNRAWAAQRWSRRISDFAEVSFPISSGVNGSPERMLDFRRFVSDEVNHFLDKLIQKVTTNAPGTLITGNMWYYSNKKYFDYSPIAYSGKVTREGCGIYPGNSLFRNDGLEDALFGMARIQFENTTPFWCTEFVSVTAAPGSIRKAAYATLMLGGQLICGWTWQSMHSGEEQYLEGLIDWDGLPNRKYEEYKQIASEFKKIEAYGFPYQPKAEVALAFSFPSQMASSAFPEQHDSQLQTCFNVFLRRNVDVRVVEVSHSDLRYKLLLLPGVALIDEATAEKVRSFVKNGGTAVMTGFSGVVDETNRVFSVTHPGRLDDVFGIRVASFEEPLYLNELSRLSFHGNALRIAYHGQSIDTQSERLDLIEPKGADVLGNVVSLDRDYPIITSHKYGAGTAIYIGFPAREEILDQVLGDLIATLAIPTGPKAPPGVMARFIDRKHALYLNLNKTAQQIPQEGPTKSVLFNRDYAGTFTLNPFEPEFVELP